MRGAVLHAPGDVRVEDRPDPRIEQPTDAVIRLAATCVCGSDLWPYRGIEAIDGPAPMGHEYVGVVEEVGSAVTTVRPGQFVVGSISASDNTCEICRAGYQTHCVNRQPGAATGAQAEYARIPLADGTLVATPGMPAEDLVGSGRGDRPDRALRRCPGGAVTAQAAGPARRSSSSCGGRTGSCCRGRRRRRGGRWR